jgi:hypothetical protein
MNEEFKLIRSEVRIELRWLARGLELLFNEDEYFVRLAKSQKRLTELQNRLHQLMLNL